jgi:CHAD domain-containing protein
MDLSFLNPELPLSALKAPHSADKALRIVLGHCLEPITVNAGKIASGTYGDEQIHQLRVGLRRLRSALHLFDGWAALPEPTTMAPLNRLFRDLGIVRDQTVWRASLRRLLREAGAPPLTLPAVKTLPDPARRVHTPEVQRALLRLMSFVSEGAPSMQTPQGQALDAWMAKRLARWHRHIQREGSRFLHLPESRRHALRKRVKTLRYGVEFVAALFPSREVARYLKQLHQLQDGLGQYVDLSLTLKWLQDALHDAPAATFATGWLGARRERQGEVCAEILAKFKKITPLRLS